MAKFPWFRLRHDTDGSAHGAGDEVDRELDYHLRRRADELIDTGVEPAEARRRARHEFGDVEGTRRYCAQMTGRRERRQRRRRLLADFGQDVRYALRAMRRGPGFAAVAVLIMALGIGATTAMFSIVDAVLLRPLDYPQSERLVQLWETDRADGSLEDPVSPVDLRDWQAQSTSLESIAGYGYQALSLSGDGTPERLIAVETSASFFEVLGTEPALGRTFHPEEEGPAHRVAVLSHGLWSRRFGADPGILGESLTLNGTPYVVIGVMPEGFAHPSSAELWVPFTFDVEQLSRGSHFLFAVARLQPDRSLREAQAEMTSIAAQLEAEYPETNVNHGVHLLPLHEQLVGDSSRALWIVFGAVSLVLVIACGNVGNMMLVRSAARSGEISIRRALGAGGWRLTRQLLAEGLVLSLLAGAAGVAAAWWGLEALVASIPVALPRASEIEVDPAVLGFALLVATVTGLAFGLAPALQSRGAAAGATAAGGGRATSGGSVTRLRDGLVVLEVALTLVLLVTAGLLIANLSRLRGVDPGFAADGVLTARLALPPEKYPEAEQRIAFVNSLREQLAGLPGIEAFGTVDSLPFSGSRSMSSFDIVGESSDAEQPRNADRREVTPGYFETMGIPLLRGRAIEERDTADARGVIVVNAAFERRFFPGDEALGRSISIGDPNELAIYGEPVEREIVGIVGDLIHDDLTVAAAPEMYLPYAQSPSTRLSIAVRAAGDPGALSQPLREAVLRVDADQPLYGLMPMEGRLAQFLAPARTNAWALGVFSAAALLLAVLGVYSVVSYSVAQRTHELGLRTALGAQRSDILRMVLRQGMTRIGLGLLLGLGAALLVARGVRGLLFDVDAADPLLLASPALILAAAGLLASLVPALRAVRIDPVQALRRD